MLGRGRKAVKGQVAATEAADKADEAFDLAIGHGKPMAQPPAAGGPTPNMIHQSPADQANRAVVGRRDEVGFTHPPLRRKSHNNQKKTTMASSDASLPCSLPDSRSRICRQASTTESTATRPRVNADVVRLSFTECEGGEQSRIFWLFSFSNFCGKKFKKKK